MTASSSYPKPGTLNPDREAMPCWPACLLFIAYEHSIYYPAADCGLAAKSFFIFF